MGDEVDEMTVAELDATYGADEGYPASGSKQDKVAFAKGVEEGTTEAEGFPPDPRDESLLRLQERADKIAEIGYVPADLAELGLGEEGGAAPAAEAHADETAPGANTEETAPAGTAGG